jgi:uncharacterized protein
LTTIRKFGIPFELAIFVFDDPMRLERADAFSEGEYRSVVTGRVNDKLLNVVYAVPADNLYRIISARLATASERDDYEQNLHIGLARLRDFEQARSEPDFIVRVFLRMIHEDPGKADRLVKLVERQSVTA